MLLSSSPPSLFNVKKERRMRHKACYFVCFIPPGMHYSACYYLGAFVWCWSYFHRRLDPSPHIIGAKSSSPTLSFAACLVSNRNFRIRFKLWAHSTTLTSSWLARSRWALATVPCTENRRSDYNKVFCWNPASVMAPHLELLPFPYLNPFPPLQKYAHGEGKI